MSKNVFQRLITHNKGQVRSTKSYVPWKVVHTETHATQVDARKREKYLKSAAGRRWRKNIWGCSSVG
ncbi:MAG: GIY-YIG nuclease family protein [Bacteroidetes bacterium]|nr:GIY-YIG nuclease family protein [Bacteroidota bacterium]MDA0888476.1 GIY-YIG nuclease family protein [Bacteroidota bacterium]MDA1084119.1 GIY-YIG nuclease family protein [Bacteroidota bacterium]